MIAAARIPGHQRVIREEPISLPVAAGAPDVVVFDALEARLDEPGLRDPGANVSSERRPAHTSRSYRYPYALVASHSEPVGVDIERIEAFHQAFLESILTPSERRAGSSGADPDRFVATLWSSRRHSLDGARRRRPLRPAMARLANVLAQRPLRSLAGRVTTGASRPCRSALLAIALDRRHSSQLLSASVACSLCPTSRGCRGLGAIDWNDRAVSALPAGD